MLMRSERLAGMLAIIAVLAVTPAYSQLVIDLADGTSVNVTAKFNKAIELGPAQEATSLQANAAGGVAFYTANYTSLGRANAFNIIGTDPSLGAATTTIPTVIIPLKFVFPNAPSLSLDGTNVLPAVQNSPLFQLADYTTGGTDIGVTQYGDAIQRAEFWNLPGFSQDGYHVLLGTPAVAPTITVNVPTGSGLLYSLAGGGLLGVLRESFFSAVLNSLLPAYTANQLPIFLTDNVYLSSGGTISGCCVLGFHNSQNASIATSKTWIYNAYTEPGTFRNDTILDVQALSHEVAEWLNDPFVGVFNLGGTNFGINLVPPYVLPGQGGACQINFETGDALEAPPVSFQVTTNGTTYHLQDEAFLPWFLQSTSFSANGFYSYLGTFTSPATLCGPG